MSQNFVFTPHSFPNFSVPPPNYFPQLIHQIPQYNIPQNFDTDKSNFQFKLTSWLSKINFKRDERLKINVSSIKSLLTKYLTLVKELERLLIYLKVGETSLKESEWISKCEEVEIKKNELNTLAEKFDNTNFMSSVEYVVRKAKKKRAFKKKKNILWQERKNDTARFRAQEHKRIDIWLEKMKSEVERAHREETVKKEADLVLSDVNLKKSEAKKMLSLLNTLTKLRNARAQQKLANGKYISEEESKTFQQVIDKLKNYWIEQLKEYKQEETGLRVMLNDAEVERKNVELANLKKITNQWNQVLFGTNDKIPKYLQMNTLEEYIGLRSGWDQYLNEDHLSSSIPVGWVIPVEPSSSEWAKYIK